MHLDHVMGAAAAGILRLAGSLYEPDNGEAMLVFDVGSPEEVEAFATADPYVINGIVSRWSIRRWDVVVGLERVTR